MEPSRAKLIMSVCTQCTQSWVPTYTGQCWESLTTREFWMSYRGPGLIAGVWFGSFLRLPLSRQQVVSLYKSSCMSPVELTNGRGGGDRIQIIWQRESLVLYKSFNTPSSPPSEPNPLSWSSLSSFACDAKRIWFHPTHTATEIPFMYSFSGNCTASVPISTFMCLWAIYIVTGSVHIFSSSRIGRPILEIYISLTDIRV